MAKGMKQEYAKPSEASRFSFYLAFGIMPYEQKLIEDYYASLDLSPSDNCAVQRPVSFQIEDIAVQHLLPESIDYLIRGVDSDDEE